MAFRRFYRRTFLKRGHHAGAYVLAGVTLERGMRSDNGVEVCAQFTVADCGRITQLDFDVHDRDTARSALHKAHTLKTVVDAFVEALERAVTESGATPRADKPTHR